MLPADKRNPPNSSAFSAYFKGKLPGSYYFVTIGYLVEATLLWMMGLTIALASSPQWIG